MKKVILSIAALLSMTLAVAQNESMNPIITAMPSMSIAPDARAAGMGDLGVATDADLNSMHWNPAKYAYMESHGGLTANYTPWLRKLVGDIDLAYLTGYYKWDDLQGVAMSFRYFSMGDVQMTNIDGSFLANARPNEWALDASYYRKLHEYVSMAVALRFMYSDLNNGVNQDSREMKPGWTMAADIALYYKQPIELPMGTSYFNLGFNLQNLGGKISYTEDIQNFIPATMRLGVGYDLPFDNYNRLTFNVEASKLMVPSRKSKFAAGYDAELYKTDPNCANMTQDEYSKLTSVKGIFQSFADAPGGAAEEFNEVVWGIGLEYTYNHQFFARAGYSHENQWKGNRRYVTLGAGFHLSIVTFDFAYCIATAASNPLDQTMRFSLGFDLAGIKDLVNNRK
ncbi:MAG: type IX secretion system outer membrane channel protein PorV [Paludibacteraceae bacterium]|nr:type IX secretion system outer membrane channel protein PorV [Paludibacteraceae bacterium]